MTRPSTFATRCRRWVRRVLAGEGGSAAIEAAVGVPAFLLLVAMILLAGRIAVAHQAVEAVAAAAARSASIARTPGAAMGDARAAANTGLASEDLTCVSLSVSVDVTGFAAPVGTPASVTATVNCVVALADLAAIPGLPGTRTVTGTMASPIDTFRARA